MSNQQALMQIVNNLDQQWAMLRNSPDTVAKLREMQNRNAITTDEEKSWALVCVRLVYSQTIANMEQARLDESQYDTT